MTLLPKPEEEGDKMTCPDCGMALRARLKTYKDDAFPAYVQWQNANETIAHKSPAGVCKDSSTAQSITTNVEVPSVTIVDNTNPILESIRDVLIEIKDILDDKRYD